MKPMLAERKCPKISTLRYPIIASPKLDGIRALVIRGRLRSRKLEGIPNLIATKRFSSPTLEGFDGELIYGDPTAKDAYRVTQSILSERDEPRGADVRFHVFDIWSSKAPYFARLAELQTRAREDIWDEQGLVLVPAELKLTAEALAAYEEEQLELGYEGLILRDPNGAYKYGRSTLKEAGMLKLKRFADAEATVVGYFEEMKNNNPKLRDKLGNAKRSSHQENKVGKGRLGKLVCVNEKLWPGVTFEVGTGFTAKMREELWARRDALAGKKVKFKYFPLGGKERPRHPVFLGWRSKWDS